MTVRAGPAPSRRSGMRAPALAAVAAAAVLCAACGVGTQASPTVIPGRTVPYGLLTSGRPTPHVAVPTEYVTTFLYGGGRLVAVSRGVPRPATLRAVLDVLAQGPTTAEADAGLASPIAAAAPLSLDRKARGDVVVDVGASFIALSGPQQAAAAAQLVYSLTAFPGVSSVTIRISGRGAQLPTGNGALAKGALDRADFSALAPL